jgi:hypothetical protein
VGREDVLFYFLLNYHSIEQRELFHRMSKIPRNTSATGSKPTAPIDPKKRPFAVRSVTGVPGSKSISPKTSPNASKDGKISKPTNPSPTSRSAGEFFDLGSKSDEFSSPRYSPETRIQLYSYFSILVFLHSTTAILYGLKLIQSFHIGQD